MKLKIKAFIYRYTGIYLAYKEELQYITSKEAWAEYKRMSKRKKLDLKERNLQGLLIGLWQAEHGFSRPASFLEYKLIVYKYEYPLLKPLIALVVNLDIIWKNLSWDLKKLWKKIKSVL